MHTHNQQVFKQSYFALRLKSSLQKFSDRIGCQLRWLPVTKYPSNDNVSFPFRRFLLSVITQKTFIELNHIKENCGRLVTRLE
jgi:hypothetical protein